MGNRTRNTATKGTAGQMVQKKLAQQPQDGKRRSGQFLYSVKVWQTYVNHMRSTFGLQMAQARELNPQLLSWRSEYSN